MTRLDPWWPLTWHRRHNAPSYTLFELPNGVKGLVFDIRDDPHHSSIFIIYWDVGREPQDWADPIAPGGPWMKEYEVDDLLDVRAFLLHLAGVTLGVSDASAP